MFAADAVDPAKALNQPHRVPVDVVVDHGVAVLQVLPLGNAVGGDEQVDPGFFLLPVGVAGFRREPVKNVLVGFPDGNVPLLRRLVVGAADQGGIYFQLTAKRQQTVVQVLGSILIGGENQQLAGIAVFVFARLASDNLFQVGKLSVPLGGDRGGYALDALEQLPVFFEVLLPALDVHSGQVISPFPALDLLALRLLEVSETQEFLVLLQVILFRPVIAVQ